MTVINSGDGPYAALKLVPEGAKMTIYTTSPGRARTNVVAQLSKTIGNRFGDWEILSRPATADDALLVADWPEDNPPGISSRTIADALQANPHLWADIPD